MRLIDADALFKHNGRSLSDAVKYGNKDAEQQEWSYSTMMMYEIADEIDNAPTIDAVPVVRCGECVYYNYGKRFSDMKWCCRLKNADGEPARYLYPPDGFCCYGARREVDGDA